MSRYCRPLYILYLPVNRLHSMLLKKLIGFTKMLATKKASVSRQRAWMRCCQYQMLWICKHRNLRLRRTPPEHIYYRSVLLIYSLYDCIRELLPAVSLMRVCLIILTVAPYSIAKLPDQPISSGIRYWGYHTLNRRAVPCRYSAVMVEYPSETEAQKTTVHVPD